MLTLDIQRNPAQNTGMHTSTSILERIGNTPTVRLDRLATGLPVPVLGKCEFLNPGGSGKDRIALAIVDDAERRNLIAPASTLIEATAGDTGIGLALVAAARGYRLVCVMPENTCARITTRRIRSRGSAAASCPRCATPE
jgi:cysteine synthase